MEAGNIQNNMEQILPATQQILRNPWGGITGVMEQETAVPESASTIYCSAQPMLDKDGKLFCGYMDAQIQESFDILETILSSKGYQFSDVASMHFYTTSVSAFFKEYDTVLERLQQYNAVPFTTIKEVKMLSFPSLLFELEVTAAK